ncbi:putative F-box/LRR-repeat protein At5g02930 [Vitis riparia]|uniref:putative F-box/LRR-repeat protein At5g02930 n=1 Tax=Vitis riparia TaxID=96939 RepID=UPI00155A69EA|nr:putative F-box/LRR-repeat protein At5g02930 [Vitis riparia]
MRTKRHCRNPPPPSNQTPRRIGEDRISALPDAVLIHILSYLPVIDAVKTGVLSKRWARLWTWTPNLVFDQLGEWDEKTNNFVPFIDAFLVLHSSPKIQKLALDLDYKGKRLHLDSSLNKWLHFATRRAAEELNLQLSDLGYFHSWDFRGPVERYLLPSFIYTNNSMKRLDMSFIDVQPPDAVSWPFLQSLSIRCLTNFSPNILSLEISGHFYKRKVQLLDLSSLVDVIINLQLWVEDRYCLLVEYSNILREILQKIRHVEKLTVGATSIKQIVTFATLAHQMC